jgi:hypothetical protein
MFRTRNASSARAGGQRDSPSRGTGVSGAAAVAAALRGATSVMVAPGAADGLR